MVAPPVFPRPLLPYAEYLQVILPYFLLAPFFPGWNKSLSNLQSSPPTPPSPG